VGKLWSKRQCVATETFQIFAAGLLADPTNDVAISRGNDASAGTMSFVIKYFCQRIHLCEADHLAVPPGGCEEKSELGVSRMRAGPFTSVDEK